jgi:SAM-dependent methyltransferase
VPASEHRDRPGPSQSYRNDPLARLYPEIRAGGFSHVDGTIAFYTRVNALLASSPSVDVLVDFGAGRGAAAEDPVPYRRQLRDFRGRVGSVVGLDIDPIVLTNPLLDVAEVLRDQDPFPLPDASVDMIVSDYCFEHVRNPSWVTAEMDRILRPDGWICARTPNRHGYVGLGARLIPNRFHLPLLRHLQPTKPAVDTFPVAYRLNTPQQVGNWFRPSRYHQVVYAADSEPAYVGRSVTMARLTRLLTGLTPARLRSMLYIFLQKTPNEV